MLIMAITGCFG